MATVTKPTTHYEQVLVFLAQSFPSTVAIEALLVAVDIPCKCQLWIILITFASDGEVIGAAMRYQINLSPSNPHTLVSACADTIIDVFNTCVFIRLLMDKKYFVIRFSLILSNTAASSLGRTGWEDEQRMLTFL